MPRVTGNCVELPRFTDAFEGSAIVPGAVTVTFAVASGMFGELLA